MQIAFNCDKRRAPSWPEQRWAIPFWRFGWAFIYQALILNGVVRDLLNETLGIKTTVQNWASCSPQHACFLYGISVNLI